VWTDADMTYPNDQIPQLVKELRGYDQIVGARTSEQGTIKALRVPAKWSIRKLACYSPKRHPTSLGFARLRRGRADQYLTCCLRALVRHTMTMTFLNNGYSVKYVDFRTPSGPAVEVSPIKDNPALHAAGDPHVLSYEPLRVSCRWVSCSPDRVIIKLVYDISFSDVKVAGNTLLLFFASFR